MLHPSSWLFQKLWFFRCTINLHNHLPIFLPLCMTRNSTRASPRPLGLRQLLPPTPSTAPRQLRGASASPAASESTRKPRGSAVPPLPGPRGPRVPRAAPR